MDNTKTQTMVIEPNQIKAKIVYSRELTEQIALEHRIVTGLIEHLTDYGFIIDSVFDGEEFEPCKDANAVLEVIYATCESSLQVKRPGGSTHGVKLAPGNGIDVICDWSYSRGDPDKFNQVMDAFDATKFIEPA